MSSLGKRTLTELQKPPDDPALTAPSFLSHRPDLVLPIFELHVNGLTMGVLLFLVAFVQGNVCAICPHCRVRCGILWLYSDCLFGLLCKDI